LINKKEKDVGGKKVEVKVPDGYELIQDGLLETASQDSMTLQLVILYRKYCCAFQPLEKGRNQQF
jgi:hypothetical protein